MQAHTSPPLKQRLANATLLLAVGLILNVGASSQLLAQKKGGRAGGNSGAQALANSGKFNKITTRPQNQRSVGVPSPRLGSGQPNPYSTNRYGNNGRGNNGWGNSGNRSNPGRNFQGPGFHSGNRGGINRGGTAVFFNYNSGLNRNLGLGGGLQNTYFGNFVPGPSFNSFGYSRFGYSSLGNSTYYRPTTVLRAPIVIGGAVPAYDGYYQATPDLYRGAYGYEAYQQDNLGLSGLDMLNTAGGNGVALPTTPTGRVQVPTTALARNLQREAEQAFFRGDYDTAITSVSQAMTLDRDNGFLLLFGSQVQFAIGDFENAANSVEQATAILPSDQWGFVVTNFRNFYGQNDYVSQTKRLSDMLQRRPTPNLLALRGFHYGLLGHRAAATSDLQRAIASDPTHVLANRLLPVLGDPAIVAPAAEIEAPVPMLEPSPTPGSEVVPMNDLSDPNAPNSGIIRLRSPVEKIPAGTVLLNPPR